MLKHTFRNTLLLLVGGSIYIAIEVLWRHFTASTPTHWTMFLVGGVIFVLIGGLNEWLPWELSFAAQCIAGTAIVLGVELVSGVILNLWLGLAIWDYSHLPGNILGQICPQFAAAWFILAGAAILIDDRLRYRLFGEEKPRYTLFSRF